MSDIHPQIGKDAPPSPDEDPRAGVIRLVCRRETAVVPPLPEPMVSPAEKALDFSVQALIQHHGPFGAYAKLVEAAFQIFPSQSRPAQDDREGQ